MHNLRQSSYRCLGSVFPHGLSTAGPTVSSMVQFIPSRFVGRKLNGGSSSDGPFKQMKFTLRNKRKNYNEVLINADIPKLNATAESLIEHAEIKKHEGFWQIYQNRVDQSLHLMNLSDLALLAKALDLHRSHSSLYPKIAARVPFLLQQERPAALSALVLMDVLSRRVVSDASRQALMALANTLPLINYQLSITEIGDALIAMSRGSVADENVVEILTRKVLAQDQSLYRNYDFLTVARLVKGYTQQNAVSAALRDNLTNRVVVASANVNVAKEWKVIFDAIGKRIVNGDEIWSQCSSSIEEFLAHKQFDNRTLASLQSALLVVPNDHLSSLIPQIQTQSQSA